MAMRSYAIARGYFSIFGFLNWFVIVLGILVTLAGMWMTYSLGQALLAAGPGLLIVLAGLYGLVLVQIGRAGVDSAEYGQQSLQLARDQFQMTKQYYADTIAKSGTANYHGAPSTPLQDISFDTTTTETGSPQEGGTIETEKNPKIIRHRGQAIKPTENGYLMGGQFFATLDEAKAQAYSMSLAGLARKASEDAR